jgi:hypothetical protein
VVAPTPEAAPAPNAPPRQSIAALPAPDVAAPPATDPVNLTRTLQTELKRVGCDPGALDGGWSAKSRSALGLFNKHAGTKFDIKVASVDALDAVRAKDARVCPLVCGRGRKAEGDSCIAAIEPPKKDNARKPPERALRDRPVASEVIRRNEGRRNASPRGGSAAACETPFTQGGRQCCTFDTGGAPRIVCQ